MVCGGVTLSVHPWGLDLIKKGYRYCVYYTMIHFLNVRKDRNSNSGKTRGGGICAYINDSSWCRNYTVKDSLCTPDFELLCLSLRPFYLPREYGNIFICIVYIPPSANASKAASRIADCVHSQLEMKPDAPMLILGDFNHRKMEKCPPWISPIRYCRHTEG